MYPVKKTNMKVSLAAATFVACKACGARRVFLEPAVHSRCAGHGCSGRDSSTSCLCAAEAGRSRARGLGCVGQVRGLIYVHRRSFTELTPGGWEEQIVFSRDKPISPVLSLLQYVL